MSRVKGLTISYCSQRSRSASQERDLLVRLAKHLKSRLDSGLVSCMGAYRSVLDRLSSLDSTAAKGAQVRSRVKWVEEGEVSSAFFFRLEKKRSADRWISALRNPNGSIVSSPSDLCASLSGFILPCFLRLLLMTLLVTPFLITSLPPSLPLRLIAAKVC